ncbi:MAG: alpha/beta fold hydrolase [Terriglobia bacterium]
MLKVQNVEFNGPAGRLEGLLKLTEGQEPKALAVVCHPHPLFHGTMHNKVTFAIADAFFRLGVIVLRFNFRGVGKSAGEHDHGKGEMEDAQAAIHFLRTRYPGPRCMIAGFSFGSWIALEVARHDPSLISVCAVAPPFKYIDPSFLQSISTPKLFLQGSLDTICPGEELQKLFSTFSSPKELVWFEGADHFFAHRLDELKSAITSRSGLLQL